MQVSSAAHDNAATNLLASTAGSDIIELSQSTPDTDGKFVAAVADFGAGEAGPAKGVLGRYTLTILASAENGQAPLTLADVVLSDPMAVAIPVGAVNSGYLDVGGSCSGSGGSGGSGDSDGGGSGSSGGGSSGGGSGSGSGSSGSGYTGGTTIAVGQQPREIAVNPNTNRAYVTNYSSNTVTIINTSTNAVVGAPVPVGDGPWGLTVNPNSNFIYVANINSGTVSVINGALAETVPLPPGTVFSLPVEETVRGMAANPATNKIYAATDFHNTGGLH